MERRVRQVVRRFVNGGMCSWGGAVLGDVGSKDLLDQTPSIAGVQYPPEPVNVSWFIFRWYGLANADAAFNQHKNKSAFGVVSYA